MNLLKYGPYLAGVLSLSSLNCALEPIEEKNNVYVIDNSKERCGAFEEDITLQPGEVAVRDGTYNTVALNDVEVVDTAEGIRSACARLLSEQLPNTILGRTDFLYCNSAKVDEQGRFITVDIDGVAYNEATEVITGVVLECQDVLNGKISLEGSMLYVSPGGETYYTPFDINPEIRSGVTKPGDRFQSYCTFPKICPSTPVEYECDSWAEFGVDGNSTVLTESDWEIVQQSGDCRAI